MITIYLDQAVVIKKGEKPTATYNYARKINQPYIDKVVEDYDLYNHQKQITIHFMDGSHIEYFNVSWSKATPHD